MPRLEPFNRPETPKNIERDPVLLDQWNKYWNKLENEWNYERDQEYRDSLKH